MVPFALSQLDPLKLKPIKAYLDCLRASNVNDILRGYGINANSRRLCHFFAQVLTESARLTALRENLSYSVEALCRTWPKRFPTAASAFPYAHDEEALANKVYGGRMGNTELGDGYRYRGRGLLQITGREAYRRYGDLLQIDLEHQPDLAIDPDHALVVAAIEYARSGHAGKTCNELADEDDIVGVTRAVNGGLNGLASRQLWLAKLKVIFGSSEMKAAPSTMMMASRASANLLTAEGAFSAAPRADFDPHAAVGLGNFIAQAYAMFAADPTSLTPAPTPSFPTDYRLVAAVCMKDFILTGTEPLFYGFVAQSTKAPAQHVLALRGTIGGIEWWDDLNAAVLEPFKDPALGAAGAGFNRIYDTLELVPYARSPVAQSLTGTSLARHGSFSAQVAHVLRSSAPASLTSASASPRLQVTGHSLGAALATLYTLENATNESMPVERLCTFASPRVGDPTLAHNFAALMPNCWRIVNVPDVVPNLPPDFLGFSHVCEPISIQSTGKVRSTVSCWHALSTYLALLDPVQEIDPGCHLDQVTDAVKLSSTLIRPVPKVAVARAI